MLRSWELRFISDASFPQKPESDFFKKNSKSNLNKEFKHLNNFNNI